MGASLGPSPGNPTPSTRHSVTASDIERGVPADRSGDGDSLEAVNLRIQFRASVGWVIGGGLTLLIGILTVTTVRTVSG